MAEEINLKVSFPTQQAAQDAQRMADAMVAIEQASKAADERLAGMQRTTAAAGTTAQQAGGQVQTAADAVGKMGAAADKTATTVKTAANETKAMGGAMAELQSVTEGMVGSVGRWIASYAGLKGVQLLLQRMEETAKATNEAVAKATGQMAQFEDVVQVIMKNLRLEGAAGQQQAMGLARQFVGATSTTFEQAASTISSAEATGFEPRTPGGMRTTQQVGKFASSQGLRTAEIEGLFRMAAQWGVKDEAGMNQFLSKIRETFTRTGTTDMAAFVRGFMAVSPDVRQRGLSMDEGLGLYGAGATLARSSEAGANQVRMFLTETSATRAKARHFLAREAQRQGVLPVPTATEGEVDEALVGTEEQEKIQRARDRQTHIKRERADAEAQWQIHTQSKTWRHLKEAERSYQTEQHRQRLADMDKESKDQDAVVAKARDKVRQDILGGKEEKAWLALPTMTRVRAMQRMMAGAVGKPAREGEIRLGLGGMPARFAALAALSTAEAVRLQAINEQAAGAADPAAIDRMYTAYTETGTAQRAQGAVGNQLMLTGSIESDEMFAARLDAEAGTYGEVSAKRGDILGGLAANEADKKINARWVYTRRYILAFLHSLSGEELQSEAGRKLAELSRSEVWGPSGINRPWGTQAAAAELHKIQTQFGALRAMILKERWKRKDHRLDRLTLPYAPPNSGGSKEEIQWLNRYRESIGLPPVPETQWSDIGSPVKPTEYTPGNAPAPEMRPRPATRPAGAAPVGPVSMGVTNVHIGNYITHPDAVDDLPGRLEEA